MSKKITINFLIRNDACFLAILKFEKEAVEKGRDSMDVWDVIEVLKKQKDSRGFITWLFETCKLTGTSQEWWSNGRNRSEASYRKGKLHGIYTSKDNYGKINVRENYRKGKLHGVCEYNINSPILAHKEIWKNGNQIR